jgi:acyl-CoA synthetase (AMP-forming)/AMP-acid ligase II
MFTHSNMVSVATSITTYLKNTPDDVILNVLPLSFGYGLFQVLMGAKIGGTVVLERSFAYPRAVVQTLVRERVTGFPLVPTMAAMLLQMDLAKVDWSSLRYLTSAGAALPTEHIVRLRKALPHVQIYSMYGLTECARVSYLDPAEIDRRPASVGQGMPNQEVFIVDEHNCRVGPGVVGELVVRGAHVMKGYWELPAETAARLRPGPLLGESVLYTGDLFRMDDEGYLYFVARKDDIIKSRGEKVSPKEVEDVLHAHPEIAEAAVVGVPDEILGQAVKAAVVVKGGSRLTERDVLRHCAGRLEDFAVPKLVEFRDSLPRTANGKIDRKVLSLAQAFTPGATGSAFELQPLPGAFVPAGQ